MKCTCHTYTRLNKNKNSSTGFAHRQIVHCSKNIHVLQFWFVCTNKPLTKAHDYHSGFAQYCDSSRENAERKQFLNFASQA